MQFLPWTQLSSIIELIIPSLTCCSKLTVSPKGRQFFVGQVARRKELVCVRLCESVANPKPFTSLRSLRALCEI
jgi:hypothetical protein